MTEDQDPDSWDDATVALMLRLVVLADVIGLLFVVLRFGHF